MNTLEVGSYVKRRGKYHIVLEVDPEWVDILDVMSNETCSMPHDMVTLSPWVCHRIVSDNAKYLVTLKDNLIISMDEERVLSPNGNSEKFKKILAHLEN